MEKFIPFTCTFEVIPDYIPKTPSIIINAKKLYINSTDNSTNTSRLGSDELKQFETLREIIRTNVENNNALLSLITEMQTSIGKPSFKEKYGAFIISAANHMTLIAPFIPILTSQFGK